MFGRSISLLVSLFLVLLFLTPHVLAEPEEQFQDLVRDVPEEILHAALHDFAGPKFQHGVFPGDRPALDVIHRERAADATRLVKLAKRQGANTTATTTTSSTSVSATTTSSIITSSARPSTSGTTPSSTSTTTTSSGGSVTAASSSKKGTSSSTSTTTRTFSGPNGVSTTTEVTVVVATPTDETTALSGTPTESTTTISPSLSGGLRVSAENGALVAVVAALGFFML